MMKEKIIDYFRNKENPRRVLTFIITFLFLFFILATSLITEKYNLKEGDIAKVDIRAPREVEDSGLTEERRQQALNSVPLQFNKETAVKSQIEGEISKFFQDLELVKSSSASASLKLAAIKGKTGLGLSDEEFGYALSLSGTEAAETRDFLMKTMDSLYDSSTISDNTQKSNQEDVKKAQEFVLIQVNSSKLSKVSREVATAVGYSEIKPNFYYDKTKTEELRREALKKVAPVMIKKDQIIVKEGEPVTGDQIKILGELGLVNSNSRSSGFLYMSLAVLVLFVMALQWFYLSKYYNDIFMDTKKLIMINMFNCTAVLLARTLNIVSPYLIPLAFIPMIFTLAVNYKVSLVSTVLNCILISGAVNFNVEITLLAAANALAGSIIIKKMNQRNEILFATLYISIMNVVLTFSIGLLISSNVPDVANKSLLAFVAAILSGILTIGFLPFLENIFEVLTTIKLLELTNPNNPLLKRLLIEAPGTYHHSILVGNLAELATEAVGGDSIFARACAYYHDVGKLKRPYFFKENQLENDNPHNKITPNLSTLIIISHVKDGVELAMEYKLPRKIIDVIEQHHGTSLVQYFYLTVKNNSLNPAGLNEEDFRYKGPIPESREAAVIMLADAVEAAVRSIVDPTREKIEAKVNYIIKNRMDDGQLNNCELTLRDIEKIRKAFLGIFSGIYHNRIEYPVDKWEK